MNATMDHNATMPPSQMHMSDSHHDTEDSMPMKSTGGGHTMAPDDPDNPQNWPVLRKVYVSLAATAFAWVV